MVYIKKSTRAVYYPRLESEIICRKIKKKDMAQKLGIDNRTLSLKLNGDVDFSLKQALTIQETWFPDIPVNELFKHLSDTGQTA